MDMHKSRLQAAPPLAVTIDVTIVNDDPPEFEMSGDGIIPVKKVKHEGKDEWMITFSNYNDDGSYHDGFTITVDLTDKTGKGYGFFQDLNDPHPSDAVSTKCVGANGHCPRRGQQWDGFVPSSVSPDRQTLVIDHPNSYLQYFGFALHFSLRGEKKPSLNFDPIGNDQNGQTN